MCGGGGGGVKVACVREGGGYLSVRVRRMKAFRQCSLPLLPLPAFPSLLCHNPPSHGSVVVNTPGRESGGSWFETCSGAWYPRRRPCGVAFNTLVDLNKLAVETPSFYFTFLLLRSVFRTRQEILIPLPIACRVPTPAQNLLGKRAAQSRRADSERNGQRAATL